MTVTCCECKTTVGEKCEECGARAITFLEIDKTRFGWPLVRRSVCSNSLCARGFVPGEGGVSHGLCDACFKAQMAELEVLYGPEAKHIVRLMGRPEA